MEAIKILIIVSINCHAIYGGNILEDSLSALQKTFHVDQIVKGLRDFDSDPLSDEGEKNESNGDPTSLQFTNRDYKIVLGDNGMKTVNSILDRLFNFTTQMQERNERFSFIDRHLQKFVSGSEKDLFDQNKLYPHYQNEIYLDGEIKRDPYDFLDVISDSHSSRENNNRFLNNPKKRRRPILRTEDAPYYFDAEAGRMRYNFLDDDDAQYRDLVTADAMRQSMILQMTPPPQFRNINPITEHDSTKHENEHNTPTVMELPFNQLPKAAKFIQAREKIPKKESREILEGGAIIFDSEALPEIENGRLVGIMLPGIGKFVVHKPKESKGDRSKIMLKSDAEDISIGSDSSDESRDQENLPLSSAAISLPLKQEENLQTNFQVERNNHPGYSTALGGHGQNQQDRKKEKMQTSFQSEQKHQNYDLNSEKKANSDNVRKVEVKEVGLKSDNTKDIDGDKISKVEFINTLNKHLKSLPSDTQYNLDSMVDFIREVKQKGLNTRTVSSLDRFLSNEQFKKPSQHSETPNVDARSDDKIGDLNAPKLPIHEQLGKYHQNKEQNSTSQLPLKNNSLFELIKWPKEQPREIINHTNEKNKYKISLFEPQDKPSDQIILKESEMLPTAAKLISESSPFSTAAIQNVSDGKDSLLKVYDELDNRYKRKPNTHKVKTSTVKPQYAYKEALKGEPSLNHPMIRNPTLVHSPNHYPSSHLGVRKPFTMRKPSRHRGKSLRRPFRHERRRIPTYPPRKVNYSPTRKVPKTNLFTPAQMSALRSSDQKSLKNYFGFISALDDAVRASKNQPQATDFLIEPRVESGEMFKKFNDYWSNRNREQPQLYRHYQMPI